MYKFCLTQIEFSDGTVIEPGDVTVIVGPNNAGKSLLLKELKQELTAPPSARRIVRCIGTTVPSSLDELKKTSDADRAKGHNGHNMVFALRPDLCGSLTDQCTTWHSIHEQCFAEPGAL